MAQHRLWSAAELLAERSEASLLRELAALAEPPVARLSGSAIRRRRRRRAALRAELARRREANSDDGL